MKILFTFILSFLFISLCLAESYDRKKHFGDGWADLDGDGQDTRQEVLIEESLIPVTFGKNGYVVFGLWFCEYTHQYFINPADVDIDHRVALSEAWKSGADKWTQERRILYANYLDDPDHLLAVDDYTNGFAQKSGKDPAVWLPPYNKDEYRRKWAAVKNRWGLCADPAELEALEPYFVEECK